MTYRELIARLPYRLRNRFDSLSGFVQSVIDELERDMPVSDRISQDQVRLIQLLVFVAGLEDFFREGTAAARSAVGGLEQLGVAGFVVGSTEFAGENENVTRGERLANSLHELVLRTGVVNVLSMEQGPAQLTQRLWERYRRG